MGGFANRVADRQSFQSDQIATDAAAQEEGARQPKLPRWCLRRAKKSGTRTHF
jgi:hypothetical protein